MKHRIKKVKFGFGQDSDTMLVKKLIANFLTIGKLTTTKQKAKVTQSTVEKLVTKAKTNTNADRNFILKHITGPSIYKLLTDVVAPALKEVKSGYTRTILLGQRPSDGAQVMRLEWAYPVVLEKPVTAKVVKKQKTEKTEKNTETPKEKK